MFSISGNQVHRLVIAISLSVIAIFTVLLLIHIILVERADRLHDQLISQTNVLTNSVSAYQKLLVVDSLLHQLAIISDKTEAEAIKSKINQNINDIRDNLEPLDTVESREKNRATTTGNTTSAILSDYILSSQQTTESLKLQSKFIQIHNQLNLFLNHIDPRLQHENEFDHVELRKFDLNRAVDIYIFNLQSSLQGLFSDTRTLLDALSKKYYQSHQLHYDFLGPGITLSLLLTACLLYVGLSKVGKAILAPTQAKEQLQLILNSTPDGVYGIDTEGKAIFLNSAAANMLGYSASELLGKSIHPLIHRTKGDFTSYFEEDCRMRMAAKTGETQFVDNEILWRKDGSYFPIEYTSTPIRQNNRIIGAVVSFKDITNQLISDKMIRTLSQAIEQSPVSVLLTDIKGNIEYVNKTFEDTTGYTQAEVLGKNPRILNSGMMPEGIYQELWEEISKGHPWQGELMNRKKNSGLIWQRVYISPLVDQFGLTTHYLALKEDITLQKRQEEKILYQANYDSLTDLPNRLLALDRLSQLIKDSERSKTLTAVIFIDLDDFKKINDSMSHEVGDRLLIQTAKRLRQTVRNEDIVCRLGGDEFIVLIGNLSNKDDIHPITRKLLKCFRNTFQLNGRELAVTASMGVAIYPKDGSNPTELLRNADAAMYHSKSQGRNTYNCYTESLNSRIIRQLELEEQLHGALDRSEFYLYYQPIIDIASNAIIGAEALLRWKNPILGDVLPDEFIPITEQTGQIVQIGRFVFENAFAMTKKWLEITNGRFKISINISPRQFHDSFFLQSIQTAVDNSSIPYNALELEITEGVLLSGDSHIKSCVLSLKELGISLAMDDFGTGYSSLSYLRKYPFNTLKIDRSFMKDISTNNADRELVNAAIALAHSLDMKVVSEGVEYEDQLLYLVERNCDYVQGYYFSKPISPDQMTNRLLLDNMTPRPKSINHLSI